MWKIPANDSVSFGTHAAVAVGLLCCDGSLSGTHRPVDKQTSTKYTYVVERLLRPRRSAPVHKGMNGIKSGLDWIDSQPRTIPMFWDAPLRVRLDSHR